MREIETTVQMKTGLQARQAALFVQVANRFAADIFLEKDGRRVNAKSIMGVMSLAIARGTTIKLEARIVAAIWLVAGASGGCWLRRAFRRYDRSTRWRQKNCHDVM